ncbi:MAG: hypothetical protein N2490_09050 [Ignavibacteria bacterium]|nr:hypothetical protein [Ignavibacteria bacterium]
MKNKIIIALLIFIIFFSCKEEKYPINIYRYYLGNRGNYNLWIIDGTLIRKEIFSDFIYGGNPEVYKFIPEGEIWIDNSINCEELELTILHEINESKLMKEHGMTYLDAHDSSLSVELQMRKHFSETAKRHESLLDSVSTIDIDSIKEISSLPDKIKLENIYRQLYNQIDSIFVWIVDGYRIRQELYPDFGFGGNYFEYYFIPKNEIWIDAQISCEELSFTIEQELLEINEMKKGKSYDDAYEYARLEIIKLRKNKSFIKNYKEN